MKASDGVTSGTIVNLSLTVAHSTWQLVYQRRPQINKGGESNAKSLHANMTFLNYSCLLFQKNVVSIWNLIAQLIMYVFGFRYLISYNFKEGSLIAWSELPTMIQFNKQYWLNIIDLFYDLTFAWWQNVLNMRKENHLKFVWRSRYKQL